MERKHMTETISYASLVERMPGAVIIFICNKKLEILHSNRQMWNLFDCRTEKEFMEFSGGSYLNLIAPTDRLRVESIIREAKRHDEQCSHHDTYHIRTRLGIMKEIDDYGTVLDVLEEGGAIFNTFTERRSTERTRIHDRLTGVYHKEPFFQYAEQILTRAKDMSRYSFAYSNIRNFKFYNMKYGRHVGDDLLKDVAGRIQAQESVVLIGRYSSDHFIVLTDDENVLKTIKQTNQDFDKEYDGTGLKLKTGFYRFTGQETDMNLAGDLAKIACDTISDTTESVIQYTEELAEKIKKENYIDAHFEDATRQGDIKVYYQPVIRTISGAICGAEALARWVDPEMGFLAPREFIPILEKKRLITKLDLYILRQVCKDIQHSIETSGVLIPVSLNLSKLDFETGDIFEEVEHIVMEYGVPRDLINLEVTESIVMSEPQHLKHIIAKFQEVGYQIWMDDFGSELSSLNVLDEYNFDEIKMDMLFLRSFDQRSKEIIRSVVQMAKRLGIQTLAEGVETKEQFEYLKEIGCEKVQGFYFSRPVTLEDLMKYQESRNIPMETRVMRSYYDRIGKIDHITELTLALVEYDQENFHFLFVNDAFERVSRELGDGGFIFTEYILNSQASPLSRKFRDLQEETRHGDDFKQMDYSINGKYFRLRSRRISAHEGYETNQVEIENLTWGEVDAKKEQMDYMFRIMYSMYDDIFLLDEESRFQNLQTNEFENVKIPYLKQTQGTILDREEIADRYVLWEDQKEFMEFTDPATLRSRLKSEPRGYETRYFRTRTRNRSYIWKANTIQYIPDQDMLIYSTRPAFFEQSELLKKIVPDYLVAQQKDKDALLWHSLQRSQTLNLFWKDAQRRFVGVNQKFLKTYGYESADVLLGKTDEDMHWHVNDGPFRDDELRVLRNGDVIVNQVGKCIIKGVLHTILATKEPVYENGRIVGLIGYFVNLDELSSKYGDPNSISTIDTATGLLSAHGMTNVIADYIEAWTGRKENFAVIHITFREYERAFGSYGNAIVNRMAAELGDMLKAIAGNDSSIARLYAGTFVLLKKYTAQEEIRQIVAAIRDRMYKVHTLAGYAATVNPVIQVSFAEDEGNMQDLISLATGSIALLTQSGSMETPGHMLYRKKERDRGHMTFDMKSNALQTASRQAEIYTLEQLTREFEEKEEWVYVADAQTYQIIYVNASLRKIYAPYLKKEHLTLEDFAGKKCYEILHQSAVPCSMCARHSLREDQFYKRTFYDLQFDGMLTLRDKFVQVGSRRCIMEITVRAKQKAEVHREFGGYFRDHSLMNDLLRKAMYEHDPSRSISILLEFFGRHLCVDRAYIGELSGTSHFDNTYEWCRYGITPLREQRQQIPVEEVVFWGERLCKGKPLILKDTDYMENVSPRMYEMFKTWGLSSVIIYPLWKDGVTSGFYAFDNPAQELMTDVYSILRTIGHFIESLMVSRDLIEQLEYISYSDKLTGFGNRFAMERYRLSIGLIQNCGIVFCDVSGLKKTNDSQGHYAGDHLLLRAAEAIEEAFGEYELYRVGGDEFVVAASDISEEEFLSRIADLRERSDRKNAPLAIGYRWKESLTQEEFDRTVQEADQKMYEDKKKYYSQSDKNRRERS